MVLRGICKKCGKIGWFLRKREFMVSKVSSKPITTEIEMCGRCNKDLAKIIKLT